MRCVGSCKKLILYSILYNVSMVYADGLPANPSVVPTTNSWITVPNVDLPATVSTGSSSASQSAIKSVTSVPNKQDVQIGNSFFPPVTDSPKPIVAETNLGEVQIGNSFFESANAKVTPIHQIGISYEDRINLSDFFIYYNQLLSNNIFYELRAYAAYNYQASNPNLPFVPLSNQANPLGYGFVGILGYVIPLNSNITLMPFLRLSYYYNFFAVYTNTNGNSINSSQYLEQGGLRLNLKVNNVFAVYASYWAGYSTAYLNGTGIYPGNSDAQISGIASTMEIGFPYKMTRSFSIAPYVDFNVNANNPNTPATSAPYNATGVTVTNTFLAIKMSYDF